MQTVKRVFKTVFNRHVRVSLYAAVSSADIALVASGDLPAWTLVAVPPFMLAILNLSPKDVPEDKS